LIAGKMLVQRRLQPHHLVAWMGKRRRPRCRDHRHRDRGRCLVERRAHASIMATVAVFPPPCGEGGALALATRGLGKPGWGEFRLAPGPGAATARTMKP